MNRRWARQLASAAVLALLGSIVALVPSRVGPQPAAATPYSASAALQEQPRTVPDRRVAFEPNRGQFDEEVDYRTSLGSEEIYLVGGDAIIDHREGIEGHAIAMSWIGSADPDLILSRLPTTSRTSYFVGDDAESWVTDLISFGSVTYANIYPKIDVDYLGSDGSFRYDLRVRPGGDPNQIGLTFEGADKVSIDPDGSLVIDRTVGPPLRFSRPIAFQRTDAGPVEIDSAFATRPNGSIGFELGHYDPDLELVIDPTLEFSTYLGGPDVDEFHDLTADASGATYAVGRAKLSYPTTVGAYQDTAVAGFDVVVTKMAADGQSLVYSTYIGGGSDETGYAIAVDAAGSAYVTGETGSDDFPTPGTPFDGTRDGADAFVAKLSADGSTLEYSTFLGGANLERGDGIAVDNSGNAYVAGHTLSTDFPLQNALDSNLDGSLDAFVTKLNPGGTDLVYSTYLGGSGDDDANAITLDAGANAWLTGSTSSTDFPTTSGTYKPTRAESSGDVFISGLDPAGASVIYGTYLGGTSADEGRDLDLDDAGAVYVTGIAQSGFPATAGAWNSSFSSGDDQFVAKIDPARTDTAELVYSGFLGGTGTDRGTAIAVDLGGRAHVVGETASTGLATPDGFDQVLDGTDALLAVISATGGSKIYATYVGGTGTDVATGLTLDGSGIDVAGYTESADFPLLNAYDAASSSFEGWMARFTPVVPFSVNSTNDRVDQVIGDGACDTGFSVGIDPECTLRAAIQEANGSGMDEVIVPAGTYTLTIPGTGDDNATTGDLDILDSITITGAGAATTVIQAGTDATNGIDRVVDVKASAADSVLISGVTIRHGQEGEGAGLRTVNPLTIEDSIVADNTASGDGAGVFVSGSDASLTLLRTTLTGGNAGDGGGITVKDGTVTVEDSTITSNTTGRRGGGIYVDGGTFTMDRTVVDGNDGEDGGAVYNLQGDVTITDSTISGNTATRLGGGIYSDSGPLTIDRSLLVANAGSDDGGAINSQGGSAVLTVTNSTISGNSTGGNGGGIISDRPATILNSTITLNTATGAGGGLNQANDVFELQNTIVAGNLSGGDCAGTFISLGNNIDGGTSCALSQPSDQSTTDPLLGPLAENGGPTQTHAITATSPAVDAGDDAAAPLVDQRGVSRPLDGDLDSTATSDIGAYEFDPSASGPPSAVDDVAATTTDSLVVVDVLANDFDPNGDPMTVDSVTQGTNGTVTNNGSDVAYTPNSSWTGTDAFTYTITDGNGGFDTAAVTVTVAPHSDPIAVWRRSGQNTPYTSAWDGSAFGATQTSATVGDFRILQGAESPTRDEAIVVGVDAGGTIAGQIWDGTTWTAMPTLGSTTQAFWWSVDVAYEPVSGDAVVVYADGTDLNYRTWDGLTWSGEVAVPEPAGGTPRQLQLAAHPSADEMTLVVSNDASQDYAVVWDGSSWVDGLTLDATGTGNDRTDVFVAYEQQSGRALVVWGSGNDDVHFRVWDGTWSAEFVTPGIGGGYSRWTTLGADPNSDNIAMAVLTNDSDVWLAVWNGSGWNDLTTATTGATGTTELAMSVGFERTTGRAIAVYGESAPTPRYRVWTNGSGWSTESSLPSIGDISNSMVLYPEPGNDGAMLAVNDDSSIVHYLYWNGTSWGSDNVLEADSGETKNQPFLFLWNAASVSPPAPPLAVDDSITMIQDTAATIDVLVNDSDPNGDPLTVDSVTQGSNGTVTNNGIDVTYTPDPLWSGIDTFTYTVSDGNAGIDSATVTVTVSPTTHVVNSTGDQFDSNPGDGQCDTGLLNTEGNPACTLRAAIQEANALAGTDQIHFDLPTSEPGHSGGIWTFAPTSPLPPLVTTMSIDATTQSGYAATPVVEVRGDSAGADIDGLLVTGDNVEIRGLAINRFTDDGIQVNAGAAGTVITANHIGTDPAGTVDFGHFDLGIDLQSGSGPTTIGGTTVSDRNLISGNGDDGIGIWESNDNVVIGNYIGTDVTGNAPLPNTSDGIAVGGTSSNNIIGQPGAGNVLSGNAVDGIELAFDVSGNVIQSNMIGLGADGTTPVANGRHGVVIYDGANNTRVGGTAAGAGNTISSNVQQGVHVNANSNLATATNVIEGNRIGTDVTGLLDRGNGTDGVRLLGDAQSTTIGGTVADAGNVISGNGGNGVALQWATDAVVAGNTIGLGADGNTVIPNTLVGIRVDFGYSPVIGGNSVNARNVISGNGQSGIQSSGDDVTIQGNYIGTDATGLLDRGNNSMGIHMTGPRPVIGGTGAGDGNVISGNTIDGIQFGSSISNGTVEGNLIGVGADGVTPLPNGARGIAIFGGSQIRIGGDSPGAGNVIMHHPSRGILTNASADEITLLGNSISENLDIGFDLGIDGVTLNDIDDVDTGPNGLLNYPEIVSAGESAGAVTVDFDLDVPAGDYRIELFTNPSGSDPSGYGEGEILQTARTLSHGGSGTESFRITYSGFVGDIVTLTATSQSAGPTYGPTSEFSASEVVVLEALYVNSTADQSDNNPGDGRCFTGSLNSEGRQACTLRAAIQEANALAGDDLIYFDVPATEPGHSSGIWTILPTAPLPALGTTISIDGSTQPGFVSMPIVELDGTGAGGSAAGLLVTGDAVEIRGLAINRFGGDGILVEAGAAGTVIAGNHIGTDPGGTLDIGNGDRGVDLAMGSGPTTVGGTNVADRNVISGNDNDGIVVWFSDDNVIIGNFIGTDVTGNAPLPNTADGIALGGTSSNNTIGQPGAGNVLSGNGHDGVELDTDLSGNVVQANIIGLGADGDSLVPNGRHGVVLYDGVSTTLVGGSGPSEGNVISGNTISGVIIDGNLNPATTGNQILGNLIGTDATGMLPRGNGVTGVHLFAGATWNTIGGTTAAERNVISDNGNYGIDITGAGTDSNVVAANYIGTDVSGTVDLGNATDGVAIRNGAQSNTVGGLTVGERNIIAGNNNDGVWITGAGTDNNIVHGNWIGYGSDSSAIPNSFHGIAVENDASDNLLGGDVPAASNRIGNSLWDGVAVANGTGTGNAIIGNSIVDNSGLGIDLNNDGVTNNDEDDSDGGPNSRLNFPRITSASESAGTVTVDYALDVAAAGTYRIEFFTNPGGADPSGYGEGQNFVHAHTVSHGGDDPQWFTTSFPGAPGDIITATTTRVLAGPVYASTSEFSEAIAVISTVITNLSGSVVEDVDGDGDILDDGVGVPGVEVSIYSDQGDGQPEAGDSLVGTIVTDASGNWSATVNGNRTYWIAVDSTDVAPAAGFNPPFGIADVWADQTYGSVGAVTSDGSTFSFTASDGPLFGGKDARVSDSFATLSGSEHLHRVVVASSDVSGIDSGFSFQAITNTADDLDPTQHQGSLRQFIENSDALVGVQSSRFAIPTTDPGYSAAPFSFTIRPIADLPTITDQAVMDGTTQAGFTGTPIIQLDGSLAGAGSAGLTVNSVSTSVAGFAINRFDIGISIVGGSDNLITGNYLGPDVTGLVGEVGNNFTGLQIANATGTVVGGTSPSDRNVISGNRLRGVWVEDFSDGPAGNASGTRITGNFIGIDANGATALPFDGSGARQQIGIALWDGPDTTIGGAAPGETNVISGNEWYGIYVWGPNATTNVIQGNIIGLDASATTPAGNGSDDPATRSGVYISNAPGNLVGGIELGEGNIIAGNDAKGVIVHNAGSIDNSVLGNQIYGNGGIGIDLETDGVTANDPLDTDVGGNELLNFPDLAQATAAGGSVSIDVTLDVPAGDYRVEFFVNPSGSDPSGYGEGEILRHAELITHPGGAAQTYQVSFSGMVGDEISATTTELLAGPTYGSTSEFSQIEVVSTPGAVFSDSSERRSDLDEVGTINQVPGKAGIAARFSGAGDRLVGPATDLVSGELTLSAWVNATGLGTDPRVVAKTAADGNTVYELLIDDATAEAVARIKVGGSTVEVRGGTVLIGTWHQLLATWEGSNITLYVDGVPVDSAPAIGALATDLTMPLVVGNVGTGTRSFNGTIDHVRVSHALRSAGWITTSFNNINDPTSFVSIGGPQTGVAGPWSVAPTIGRTGSFALTAPETATGSDAWATAIGIDEPGVEFEAWWQLSDPTLVEAAGGTRTGAASTDQNETALAGSVFDLGSIVGATRIQDASSATGAPPATWVKVVIKTDETGTSSLWIDGVMAIGPTLHGAGGSSGSVGLRVGELPSGETWFIDDVQLRRLVSDEPVTSLGPLDRN